MSGASSDLGVLSRGPRAEVPRPSRRWGTRVVLPLMVVLGAGALFLQAARHSIWPATEVWVVPVVVRAASGNSGAPVAAGQIVQAPGWVEADPYPISIPALAEGVVREVLVLEGQRVEAGEVVARLIDDEAKLRVRRAEAELEGARAVLEQTRAAVAAAESRTAEVADELNRKRPLLESGGVTAAQIARLELRLEAMKREADAARAGVRSNEAAILGREVEVEEAGLLLARMEVRTATGGVVLERLIEPGTRIAMSSASPEAMPGTVARLYDPSRLQVRVEVPLGDVANVGIGTPAEVVTEAAPGVTFKAVVTRIVHEANIQRNTVQVKAAIESPSATLKPEMLARVRFFPKAASSGAVVPPPRGDGMVLVLPADVIQAASDGKGTVWIVDQAGHDGAVAARREVTVGPADADGQVVVSAGLREGDRVIADPPAGLAPGARVKVMGERTAK